MPICVVVTNSNLIDHVIFNKFFDGDNWVIQTLSKKKSKKKKYILYDGIYDVNECSEKDDEMGYKLLSPLNFKNTKDPQKIKKHAMNKRDEYIVSGLK